MDLFESSKALSVINTNIRRDENQTENFWCRVVVAEKESFNTKNHRHSFFELHLCLEGTGEFEVCGKKLVLTKNKYILIAPTVEHKIISQPNGFRKFIWGFSVKDKALSETLSMNCIHGLTREINREVLVSLDIMLRNAYEHKFGYYDVIIGQLSNIFALLVRDICDISDETECRKKPSLFLSEVKKYICDNLQNCPSSEDIAAQFSKSSSTLDKICKNECGLTISALRKKLQFEKIKQLLSETEHTFDEISDLCGFSDRFTMGKFFKKIEGMPPGEYRKSYRK